MGKLTYQNCFHVNWNSICPNSGGDFTLLDFLFSPFAMWGLKNQWLYPLILRLVIRRHDSNSTIHLRIATRKNFKKPFNGKFVCWIVSYIVSLLSFLSGSCSFDRHCEFEFLAAAILTDTHHKTEAYPAWLERSTRILSSFLVGILKILNVGIANIYWAVSSSELKY